MSYRPKRCPKCGKIFTSDTEVVRYCSEDGVKLVPEERRKGTDRRTNIEETSHAHKAETALRELTPGGSEFQTVEECRAWIEQRLAGRARAVARIKEQDREIERLTKLNRKCARDWWDAKTRAEKAEAERDKLIGVLEGMVEHPYHVPEWDYGKTCSCSKCEQARTVLAEVKEKG